MSNSMRESIAAKVRKMRRSADDKLLLKYGIIREDGTLRKEGRFLVAEKVFEGVSDVRAAILADVRELDDAETGTTTKSKK